MNQKFTSFVSFIEEGNSKTPDKVCLVDSLKEFTYQNIYNQSYSLADYLLSNGKTQGYVIVRTIQNCEFISFFAASVISGNIFFPVDEKMPHDKFITLVSVLKNISVIISDDKDDVIEGVETLTYSEALSVKDKKQKEYPVISRDDFSLLLFTTGSTGDKKPVMERNSLFMTALSSNEFYGYPENKPLCSYIFGPLNHFGALENVMEMLYRGGRAIISPGLTRMDDFFDKFEKYHVNCLYGTPSSVQILINLSRGEINKVADKIDLVKLGGEKCRESSQKMFLDVFPHSEIVTCYGSTECGGIAVGHIKKDSLNDNYVGNLFEGITSYKIVNSKLYVKSEYGMLGYLNNQAETEKVIENGFYNTGDLVYFKGNELFLMSREGDTIFSGGLKINPYEVEKSCLEINEVTDCVCVGESNSLVGTIPVLYVAVNTKISAKQIKDRLRNSLEDYMIPRKIVFVDKIEKSENGKTNRKYYKNIDKQ